MFHFQKDLMLKRYHITTLKNKEILPFYFAGLPINDFFVLKIAI